jgi:anti-sigma B factor antagonist
MHFDERIRGEVAVIELHGELLDDNDNLVLQREMTSLKLDDVRKVVFDLGRVNRINSKGLSALISAVKVMSNAGGEVRFAQIDKQIREIFIRTRLVQVFDTYETVERAVASYIN